MSAKTMILVDGENLIFRYQAMLEAGWNPRADVCHSRDAIVWHPSITHIYRTEIVRVSYYTTKIGDDGALLNLSKEISKIKYYYTMVDGSSGEGVINPRIYKKQENKKKTKSVDINITIDALRHTYNDSVDVVYLLAGDGDYIPLIEEIMRQGKIVWVGAFSSGLHPDLMHIPDDFISLDNVFFSQPKQPSS